MSQAVLTPDAEAAPRPASWPRLVFLALVVAGAFASLAFVGLRSRDKQRADRDAASLANPSPDRPRVLTVRAELAPAAIEQVLPGSAAPMRETAVFARTTGYLKSRAVDIGDRVADGQLIAEVESPEIDGQLLQARGALAEARAARERAEAGRVLAAATLARNEQAVKQGALTRQEYDEAAASERTTAAGVRVAEAAVQSGEANVRRLEDLQRFQKVHAPFAGVVTARNYDVGALIVADNAAARELFHVAEVTTLRVFADVPQAYSTAIAAGQPAPVFRAEAPGREFPGAVARTTNAIDPATRTLRVQVDVPNADSALLPGMYLQVRFKLAASGSVVRVPGAAVAVRADGAKVAVLDGAKTVRYRAVKLGRDFGTAVEVVAGLAGGETLVARPGDDLAEGAVVEVAGGPS